MYPSFEDAKKLADRGDYRAIPISVEMFSDIITPIELLRVLKAHSRHCFIFESVDSSKRWGRYTFLGFVPKMEVVVKDGTTTVSEGSRRQVFTEPPKAVIQRILDENRSPKISGLPPFTGGLVGYFSYDYTKYSEKNLEFSGKDEEGFNDADLMLFDEIIAFDNFRQKIILIVNIGVEDFEREYKRASERLGELARMIKTGTRGSGAAESEQPDKRAVRFEPLFSKSEYCAMVDKVKHYIKEGDIFQVVLSNRLAAAFDGNLLETYRVLRTTNPSSYMFYLGSDNLEIAGASPETLIKLEDGVLHTFPLAGTRPRGKTDEEDRALERELLSDEKELAEHNMLVDLGRNDLGKISEFGTVRVEEYKKVERYSYVMHIGSSVSGRIKPNKTALDAIDAVLPAGTLSGAPKIRAMQIIDELENNKRGIYGGAIGYLDFTGNMDVCIAIRIAFKKNGKVFVRSGAGIVADSVAEREYDECVNKAKAIVEAIQKGIE
ncbi:MAG: anthranilate synthase component I [Clostridiales bacterium]|jgi:anthranilate synthase component 1|nr:anthranilate synthase component I [Clostridiales bacterium]